MEIIKNTGFIPVPTTDTDFVAGAVSGITYREVLPSGNWTDYLPTDEFQNGGLETMACVTFSGSNCLEMQLNRLVMEDLIPDKILDEMRDLGYFDVYGLANFSDRFTAKMDGTTTAGNSMPNVWNAIRHYGLIGEAGWPSVWTTWGDYYRGIPQALKDRALKFLNYFDVLYEYITNGGRLDLAVAQYHLKQAPIHIASAVCSGWNVIQAPVIQKCNEPINHATAIYNADDIYYDNDSYGPYKKKLAGDYNIPFALKGILIPKFILKQSIMSKLIRKKNTQEVFLVLNGKRYWIKDVDNFDDLVKEQPVTVSWEQVEVVDIFTQPYGGEIIGKANLADALKIMFGKVN